MNIAIENLDFPCDIIKKLKMKVSTTNLDIKYLAGHIIKFDKTNLSIREPHRIIVNNSKQTLVAVIYDDSNKIYLPNLNILISFTKFVNILNIMNQN